MKWNNLTKIPGRNKDDMQSNELYFIVQIRGHKAIRHGRYSWEIDKDTEKPKGFDIECHGNFVPLKWITREDFFELINSSL